MYVSEPKAFVIGNGNKVSGDGSIVKGNRNNVVGVASTVVGDDNIVLADRTVVIGKNNTVSGSSSVVKGISNHVTGHGAYNVPLPGGVFDYCFTAADCASAISEGARWAKDAIEGSGILKRESRSHRITIHVNLDNDDEEQEEINPIHAPSAPVVNTDINDIKDLVSTPAADGEKVCIICSVNAADVIAMPCGHKQFCPACASRICGERQLVNSRSGMAKCPSCAADVSKFGRVYF